MLFGLQVEDLEAQLAARPQLNELQELQAALAVAKEEKACLEKCLVHSEERNALLEGAGTALRLPLAGRTPERPCWLRPNGPVKPSLLQLTLAHQGPQEAHRAYKVPLELLLLPCI